MDHAVNREAREPLFTPAFILLGVADLVYFTAVGVSIHSLPLFVTGPVGSDEAGAGLAFGAFALMALLLRPFAGRLADQIGRRPLLVAGALVGAAGLALMPLAETLALVVAFRLLQGVGEAAFFVAGFAMLADLAPRARTGEALSYNSLGLYLGLAMGPPLGAMVLAASGFTMTWVVATILMVLAAGMALLLSETHTPDPATADGARHLIHLPAVPPALGLMASILAAGGFMAFASLHSTRVGMANTSAALTIYGLVVVICRLTLARVPDRLPALPLGAASLAAIAGGLALIAAWTTPAGLLLGTAVMAVGVAFSTPAFFSAVFSTAAPHQRGAAAGTASAALDLGLGLGPLLLGLVARDQGVAAALAAAAFLALIGAVWTWSLVLRRGEATPR
ncbi:MFS transporter [Tessaracoccus sp. Y1736]